MRPFPCQLCPQKCAALGTVAADGSGGGSLWKAPGGPRYYVTVLPAGHKAEARRKTSWEEWDGICAGQADSNFSA